MAVFKRVRCNSCKTAHNIYKNRERLKELNCRKCGSLIKITADNTDYFIEYSYEGRRTRQKVGKNCKVLAENALAKKLIEIAENKFLDIHREEKIKFEDFADEYLNLHCKVNNKSWFKSDFRTLTLLNRYFSGRYLTEITPHLVQKFKSERAMEVAPATVNRQLACLKSVFNKAIAWGKFDGKNPVVQVKLFRLNNARTRILEKDEITKLLENCHGHLKAIVTLAINTGMRKSEILGLKWRDVDIHRGILCLEDTKNGESREVPLNEQVKTAIINVRKNPNSEFIFYKKDGNPLKDIRTIFSKALKKAGIENKAGTENFVFHSLRHVAGSYLSMAGVDIVTIGSILGHKDLKMAQRYSHASFLHKQKAVELLGKKLGAVEQPKQVDNFDNWVVSENIEIPLN